MRGCLHFHFYDLLPYLTDTRPSTRTRRTTAASTRARALSSFRCLYYWPRKFNQGGSKAREDRHSPYSALYSPHATIDSPARATRIRNGEISNLQRFHNDTTREEEDHNGGAKHTCIAVQVSVRPTGTDHSRMDVLQQNDLEYLFSKVAPQTAEATSINAATSASNLTVSTTSGGNTTGSTTLSLFAPPTASSPDSGASLSQFLCPTLELPAVDDTLTQQTEAAAASTSPVATATATATAATLAATGGHISNINNINRAIQETVSGFENSAQLHKLFKTEGSESGELQSLPAIFDLPPLPATDASSLLSPGKVSSSSSPSSTEFCTPASSPLSQQLVMQEAESSETPSPLLPPYPLAPLASSSSSSAARKRSMDDAGLSSGSSSFPSVPVVNSGGFDDAPRLSIDIHSQRTSIDNSAMPDGATSALSSSVSSPQSSFQDEVEPSQGTTITIVHK